MDFYNQTAKGYDELYGAEQKLKLELIKKHLKIRNTDFLLDVGCGTGLSSEFGCFVIGLDPSPSLLKLNKTPKKVLAKAESIPFKNRVFDKVVSLTAIHNFDDCKKGIKEMKRVGKNDFAFGILKKSSKFGLIEKELQKSFKVKKKLDGGKDFIFICRQ